jgi:hypothetical protein
MVLCIQVFEGGLRDWTRGIAGRELCGRIRVLRIIVAVLVLGLVHVSEASEAGPFCETDLP